LAIAINEKKVGSLYPLKYAMKGGFNEGVLGCYQTRIAIGEGNKKSYTLLPM
jgi:hypothetical protein